MGQYSFLYILCRQYLKLSFVFVANVMIITANVTLIIVYKYCLFLSPVSTRAYAEFSDLKDRCDTETVLKTEAEHYASKVGDCVQCM